MTKALTVARTIAPDDIKIGSPVMILHEMCEFLFLRPDFAGDPQVRKVPVRWVPDNGQMPLRVVAVCLPFVLVVGPDNKPRTIDTRRVQLAAVHRSFA